MSKQKIEVQEEWLQPNGLYKCPYCGKEYKKLGISYHIWKTHTEEGKDFDPNRGYKDGTRKGVGSNKPRGKRTKSSKCSYLLEDILDGKYPQYQSRKLKLRLFEEGILEDKCCKCGWDKKREGNNFTACELHHKDGNPHNHKLDNLEILCPNCHSLTENFRYNKRE